MKYPGVTLDEKLNWNLHFNNTLTACKRALMYTSNIIRKRWGPKPSLSKWLFTGIIRPKLTYASLVWGHTLTQESKRKKLRRLNRLAAITITPVRRSTPTLGLEVIYDLMPLDLFIKKTALASKHRLREVLDLDWQGTNKSGKTQGHLYFWETTQEKMEIKAPQTDSCREQIGGKKYKINKDSFEKDSKKHLCKSQITVYTDGSKTDYGVGCGFVVYKGNKIIAEDCIPLNKECTVYQAELVAIKNAAIFLTGKATDWRIKYVKFLSDSLSSLQTLDSLKQYKNRLQHCRKSQQFSRQMQKGNFMLDKGSCRTCGQ